MKEKICIALIGVVIVGGASEFAFSQRSNVADQRFLDNADQFSEDTGIRVRSVRSYSQRSDDVYLAPTTEQRERRLERRFSKDKSKKKGFSFSDMASISRKNQKNANLIKKGIQKERKGRKFTFSNMADYAQKRPSLNRTIRSGLVK